MTQELDAGQLAQQRASRLAEAVGKAPFDVWLAASFANVCAATGHRNPAVAVGDSPNCVAVVTPERVALVGPQGEYACATRDAKVEEFYGFGRFSFAARTQPAPLPRCAGLADGIAAVLGEFGAQRALVGVDAALDASVRVDLATTAKIRLVDDEDFGGALRAAKTPAEVDRLRRSAHLAETGIAAAIASARVGVTELDLMAVVGEVMLRGGGFPEFIVVTSGERSAHSDAPATTRRLCPGDLVRFDVGCTIDGYWSDVGRTAVVGVPSNEQVARYAAIAAGEWSSVEAVRPGITAAEVFASAVAGVERAGLAPFRRHHCGHGIGLEVYERPLIVPDNHQALCEGMVLCLETPFYELDWGGMMIEDTVVVTDDGCTRLTTNDRALAVIE